MNRRRSRARCRRPMFIHELTSQMRRRMPPRGPMLPKTPVPMRSEIPQLGPEHPQNKHRPIARDIPRHAFQSKLAGVSPFWQVTARSSSGTSARSGGENSPKLSSKILWNLHERQFLLVQIDNKASHTRQDKYRFKINYPLPRVNVTRTENNKNYETGNPTNFAYFQAPFCGIYFPKIWIFSYAFIQEVGRFINI